LKHIDEELEWKFNVVSDC